MGRAARLWVLLAAVLALAFFVGEFVVLARTGHEPGASVATFREEVEGRDEQEPVSHRPGLEACFAAESFRPGEVAVLHLYEPASQVTLGLYRVGDAVGRLRARDEMRGIRVGAVRRLGRVARGQTIRVQLGRGWPSGLYFARLSAARGRVGYAPFVLAPKRLGEHAVAVVLPTQTWQAYNFRDDDGNGTQDTWYAAQGKVFTARLIRPFQNRGVPNHYRYYDEPFLRWLARNHDNVDFLSDAELRRASGAALAHAYKLLVFEGHHEYVTEHEYDAVTGFRDRGGNLMFLSANNFFYKITISDNVMTRVEHWRDLGRPEAALVGTQYFGYDEYSHGGAPWKLTAAPAGRWIFAGTGLRPGALLSSGGIEADHTCGASPSGTQILAEIPNAFGSGVSAQMTYYRAASGAQVFAAGAFSLACSVWQPPVRRVMTNLIERFSRSPHAGRAGGNPTEGRTGRPPLSRS